VSGSGISWAVCKSAPRSRQITTPVPHHSVFTGRMPFLPPNQQRQSTEGTKVLEKGPLNVVCVCVCVCLHPLNKSRLWLLMICFKNCSMHRRCFLCKVAKQYAVWRFCLSVVVHRMQFSYTYRHSIILVCVLTLLYLVDLENRLIPWRWKNMHCFHVSTDFGFILNDSWSQLLSS